MVNGVTKKKLVFFPPEATATRLAGHLSQGRNCYNPGNVPAKEQKSATRVALCLSKNRNCYESGTVAVNEQKLLRT